MRLRQEKKYSCFRKCEWQKKFLLAWLLFSLHLTNYSNNTFLCWKQNFLPFIVQKNKKRHFVQINLLWWKTALTANSTGQTSAIVDLKFNNKRKCSTENFKIYSQLVDLKKYYTRTIKYFEIYESPLDSANVTICKVQSSIISMSKVGRLRWIEYIDRDVFTVLKFLGFHHEHKVNKRYKCFPKFIVF